MKFQIHQPSPLLQSFIHCYLEADGMNEKTEGHHTLFPNGFPGIFFNFGNPGKMILDEVYTVPPVSIYGQIDHHFIITHQPGCYSIGVLLKPTVLSKLLRTDMSAFTNKVYDGRIIRNDLQILHDKLQGCASIKQKTALIDAYFIANLSVLSPQQTITDHALALIHGQEIMSIQKLADELGFSQRYLEKNFKKTVGLSPKTYSLIIRFKYMEQQLKNISAARWRELNFASGYHDQNHFIKDFKRFTGLTPSDYLLENLEMGRSYLVAG
jgi:AraC-like DNA-binding protein